MIAIPATHEAKINDVIIPIEINKNIKEEQTDKLSHWIFRSFSNVVILLKFLLINSDLSIKKADGLFRNDMPLRINQVKKFSLISELVLIP